VLNACVVAGMQPSVLTLAAAAAGDAAKASAARTADAEQSEQAIRRTGVTSELGASWSSAGAGHSSRSHVIASGRRMGHPHSGEATVTPGRYAASASASTPAIAANGSGRPR
jgi:hypothetical protein